MGSKIHFHGSHKPQNGFILISSFGFLPIFMELRSLEQLHMTSAVLSSQLLKITKILYATAISCLPIPILAISRQEMAIRAGNDIFNDPKSF